ncbi:MAG: SDR family NAD(P)-dependent oxidoreductase [Candidatus Solibacter sp.]
MKNVLITGGAGFIGSHLVDWLARSGTDRITVVDNLRRGKLENLQVSGVPVNFVQGDIRDRTLMEDVMRSVTVVYHLAAQSNVLGAVEDLDYSFSTNVTGTVEVLRAAAKSGVRRVVFTSSREVYGDPERLPVMEDCTPMPKNAYGASKAAAEMYCRVFSGREIDVAILRLANVYGPRDFDRVIPIFLGKALSNLPLTLFGGNQTIDFVPVQLVIAALIRAGEGLALPGPINVGSGRAITVMELAKRVVVDTGSTSEIRIEPPREVEVTRFVASTRQLKEVLGLAPPDDPLERLADLIEWTRGPGSSRW